MIRKLLKKKQHEEEYHPPHQEGPHAAADDESNWLVSYADMMTLLCGFFIMLFSMAKLDDAKFEAVKEAVSKEFGGEYRSESKQLAEFVTALIEEQGLKDQTVVQVSPSGVAMTFRSTVFFDTLSSDVTAAGRKVLDGFLVKLMERQKLASKEYKIVVEGHTDGRPVLGGGFPTNWELSSARAARVVRMFIDSGFGPSNLTAIGYADTRPEVPHRTPSGTFDEVGLSKNRRVVIRVLDPRVDSIPYPEGDRTPASIPAKQGPDTPQTSPAQGSAPLPANTMQPAASPQQAPKSGH